MPKISAPHRGSLQVWPRVRANRAYARIRTWLPGKDAKPMGFAGYKAGMTHVIITDSKPSSMTKNMEISIPVTVIECPPLRVASVRFYKNTPHGLTIISEVFAEKNEKELGRKISLPKKVKKRFEDMKLGEYTDIRIQVYTQPKLTGIGKKKPEVFELGLGGKLEDKLNYAKNILGKEIRINDVLKEGQRVDAFSITKGHGTQGPRRRFGVMLRQHKSEKAIRNPGNVGPWTGPASWRVAHAGKTGWNQRMEYNKWVVKIGDNPNEVNPKGGFVHYGIIRGQFMLVKGSLGGSSNRLIMFTEPRRHNRKISKDAPTVNYISQESKQ